MKKIILLCVAFVCSLASYAQTFMQDDLTYIVISGTNEVSVGSLRIISPIEFNIPDKVTYNNVEYNVTTIRKDAFNGCTGLTSITIPNSIITIEDNAFRSCYNLTSITIPSSVVYIGNDIFNECFALIEININYKNNNYASENGVFFNKEKTELIRFPSGKQGNYSIPSSVIDIRNRAFYFCKNLTSITMTGNVVSIGNDAFWNCIGLISINIFDGVKTIGNRAFYNCSNLASITIPESVTNFGSDVFSNCNNLLSITVQWVEPSKVTYGSSYISPLVYDPFLISSKRTLNIPKGTLAAYQASVWSDFILKEQEESNIENILSENYQIYSCNEKIYIKSNISENINIYSITGLKYTFTVNTGLNEFTLPKGIYIVNGKKIII